MQPAEREQIAKELILAVAVEQAWEKMQDACQHRNPARDDEGQGRICEHKENRSSMEWCDPSYCPLLDLK